MLVVGGWLFSAGGLICGTMAAGHHLKLAGHDNVCLLSVVRC